MSPIVSLRNQLSALWRSALSNTAAQKQNAPIQGPGRGFQLNTEYRLLLNTDFHRLFGFRQAIQNILVGAELDRLVDFWVGNLARILRSFEPHHNVHSFLWRHEDYIRPIGRIV